MEPVGRLHGNLRSSVIDRCNIRCFYCMPEETPVFGAREEILNFEEVERFVRIAVGQGVRKLRITGGEPLVRKNLDEWMERLCGITGVEDVALTSNGHLLAQPARALYKTEWVDA